MRRFARLPSRILAVSAATFIGALGAVALTAAPASAHHATLVSTTECVVGKPNTAKVTWTITNTWRGQATVTGVVLEVAGSAPAAEVGDIKNTATVRRNNGTLVGSKEFSTTGKPPTLKATVGWDDKVAEDVGNEAVWPKDNCAPKKVPTYKAVSNCDGTQTITIVNTSDATRKFVVNGNGAWKETKDLKVGEEWVVLVPQEHARKPSIKWKLDGANKWEVDEEVSWVKPDTCFTAKSESTCEALKITVENTGAKAIKAVITVGETPKETTIEPGKNNVFTAEGVEGLVAKLVVNDGKAQEFTWTKPTDCGGAGGGLPTTGVNAGLLAGAAFVLVSGGGGLFYLARRRRIRFAA
ncbi:hypothetical protein [Virgisporangium aurantiacum]|uniref:LPXTG-motif cell wall anchor domain-containing protein n=1 Tax=Virgisporangium aurantiacum TaxID=175570 RepID=A0A8J3ZE25_9ACTN|nr:hypothetical protein [Virgisporangium aurantiacum]GIJ59975.1 hypothetical protein Vau01_074910 [Virgisporangium aurantiacum]